ncbi:TetR/AcrR family transcriptional regulator [Nocardia xishanensis]|uniref:TetR/AcrR family transcriptional regulator n=1 Tax=Nocardia xishanensis TaxID=238964 RepID=UPI000AA3B5AF|nr:TetR/AcrR family transcriptional regulator [Nocardia xishanensis]
MIETTDLHEGTSAVVGVGEPKQQRSRETRDALLDAFVSLLDERPYADIGVAEIARRAGLTSGALYGRFGDKRGLALAAHERFAVRSAETMEAWGARPRWQTALPREIIGSWTKGAVNFCRMYRPMLSLMINDPDVGEQYDQLMGKPPRILARLLRDAVPGSPGVEFEKDVEWSARAALAVLERFDLDDDDLFDRIELLLCRMIGVE